jgi:hypothetical protein
VEIFSMRDPSGELQIHKSFGSVKGRKRNCIIESYNSNSKKAS